MRLMKLCPGMLLLMGSGCFKVGPDYKKPILAIPQAYNEMQTADCQGDLTRWWKVFQDPGLDRLIEKAVLGNYDLRIAVEKIEELRAEYGIRRSNLLPQFFAYGLAQREKYSANFPLYSNLCPRTLTNLDLNFEGIWELDFWGRLRRAKDAACYDLQAQIEQMRDVYIILLADVANTYIDIQAQEEKIHVRERQIVVDAELLALTQDRFSAGLASNIPYQEQIEQLLESKNTLLLLKTSRAQACNSLAVLLGENPESCIVKNATLHVPCPDELVGLGLPSDLLRRRPDIRQAERQLASANQQVGIAVSDYFPRFFLLGGVGPQSDKWSNLFNAKSFGWSIGPAFFWPIITFGRIKYNIQAKESLERQSALEYAQAVLNAFKDVENALVQFFNTSKQLELLEEKLSAARKKKELAYSLFKAGLTSQKEYLFAEKEYLDVSWQVIDAKQTVRMALVVVYKSLGGGW